MNGVKQLLRSKNFGVKIENPTEINKRLTHALLGGLYDVIQCLQRLLLFRREPDVVVTNLELMF